MDALIEALTILRNYTDNFRPTHCEHDILYIPCVNVNEVTPEDLKRLEELNFEPDEDVGGFSSSYFGSC